MNDLLGTIPQWITAAGVSGVIMAYWRRGIQLRGLQNAERGDVRDHLAQEVERLTKRVDEQDKRYNDYQKEADRRWREAIENHEQCVAERNQLRAEIEGLKRQIARYSADQLMILEDRNCPSPAVSDAARRVRKHTDES